MEQIKYILYSVLIIIGAALTYAVMKPMVDSPGISSPEKANQTMDGITPKTIVVKNVAGKTLFSANCQTCHSVYKQMTCPALADVETRGPWTKRENLFKWVKNPAAFVSTNPYAKELSVQYNGQIMPSFAQLDEKEINQIFDYIKEASAISKEGVSAVQ